MTNIGTDMPLKIKILADTDTDIIVISYIPLADNRWTLIENPIEKNYHPPPHLFIF